MQASPISPLGLPLGATQPRANTHPPYVDSYGPEAIELARRAGLYLDPWQCDSLTILLGIRDDGLWACPEYCEVCPRQNGKGAILEARVLAGLFLLGEQLIMWSSHEFKTLLRAFRRFLILLRTLGKKINERLYEVDGIKIKITHGNTEKGVERLDTGQQLVFIARSKSSGRGFSGDLNIIDETFAYTSEQQDALMPTGSATPNPQMLYTSTPPLDGESGDVLYRLRDRGEAGDDPELAWRDWGLEGDLAELSKIDLADPANWAKANPALGIRLTHRYTAREYRTMSHQGFARERLGIWPKRVGEAGRAISKELWHSLLDVESRRAGDITLAIDVTPLLDRGSIGLWGDRADGLGHAQLVDYRLGIDWIIGRLLELCEALDPVAIVLDEKSGAMALVDELKLAGIALPANPKFPRRGDLLITGTAEIAIATGQILSVIARKGLRHKGQEPLTTAAENVKTRPIGDAGAVAFGRKISSVDIGPMQTITLARYGHLQRQPMLSVGPNLW